ncbi:hypothetical protein L7F22_050441 [Adiantum nelumboides]|nr:hypothetical protein [Adiantum nelumboides]
MEEGRAGLCIVDLVRLLQECLHSKDWASGRRLHALALVAGFHTAPSIAHLLLRIFSSATETLIAASSVFCTLPCPSPESWHAIIAAHSNAGHPSATLDLYHSMICNGLLPTKSIFLLALKACATIPALIEGLLVHHNVIYEGLDLDVYVSSTLVYMYAKGSSLVEARSLFDTINQKTLVSWNAMLDGYVNSGQGHLAIELFASLKHDPDKVTFSCIIKACSMVGSLERGKHAHQHAVESGVSANQFVASSLVDMYVKLGALHEAHKVFASLQERNVVVWNTLISGYVCHGLDQFAIQGFIEMQHEKLVPNKSTISTVLNACGNLGVRDQGRILHALMLENRDLVDDVSLGSLVDMYVKCGDFDDARSVLHMNRCLGKASWGAMLAGCAQQQEGFLALKIFEEMQCKSIVTDSAIYTSVLKAASLMRAIEEGKFLHNQIVRDGLETDIVIGSALSDMYNKCGTLDNAYKSYEAMSQQDLVSWSTMLAGYVQHGRHSLALELFEQLKGENVKPDRIMISSVLNACGGLNAVEQGKCLHHEILRTELHSDESLQIVLINMYIKCGYLDEAVDLFERLVVKDSLAWGAIIIGHVQHGNLPLAHRFFVRMQDYGIEADVTILMSLLKTCNSSQELKFMHEKIRQNAFETHLGIGNSLIDMYGETGNLEEARNIFDRLLHKDVITWNSMIAGYAEHGLIASLLELYGKMKEERVELDTFTYACFLKACCKMRVMDLGNLVFEQIFRRAFETDVVIMRSAIEMYAELGSLEDARNIFVVVSRKCSSLLSVMLGAFSKNNHTELATQCCEDMQKHGVKPDERTRTSVLASASQGGEWEQGLHYLRLVSEESGFDLKIEHFNCAVDFLGRSGHIHEAGDILQAVPYPPDLIGLTSLLAARRSHGDSEASKNTLSGG